MTYPRSRQKILTTTSIRDIRSRLNHRSGIQAPLWFIIFNFWTFRIDRIGFEKQSIQKNISFFSLSNPNWMTERLIIGNNKKNYFMYDKRKWIYISSWVAAKTFAFIIRKKSMERNSWKFIWIWLFFSSRALVASHTFHFSRLTGLVFAYGYRTISYNNINHVDYKASHSKFALQKKEPNGGFLKILKMAFKPNGKPVYFHCGMYIGIQLA